MDYFGNENAESKFHYLPSAEATDSGFLSAAPGGGGLAAETGKRGKALTGDCNCTRSASSAHATLTIFAPFVSDASRRKI
jgi:hypothetical protein